MIKRIIPFLAVLTLLVAMFVVPVSAVKIGDNDFFDFDDYASYQVLNDTVTATVTLPDGWFYSQVSKSTGMELFTGRQYSFNSSNFFISYICPFGFAYPDFTGTNFGKPISNAHFMDLRLLPKNFVLYGTFDWRTINMLNFNDYGTVLMCNFVDDMGNLVDSVRMTKNISTRVEDGMYVSTMSYSFNSADYNIPVSARGIFFSYCIDVEFDYTGLISVNCSPFTILFDTDNAFISNNNEKIIRDEVSNISNALDNIANGEVTARPPDDAGAVGDLEDIENDLKNNTAQGRDEAEQIFNESSSLIASHIAGFLFLSAVIERFIAVGWLRGVLTVSLSLGILGFVANIAMIASRKFNSSDGAKKGGKT